MRIAALAAAALLATGTVCASAAEPPPAPAEAKNVITVFVNKGSPGSLIKAVNRMHATMEAEGWTFRDMNVYTEDGDLEGLFVTYVRASTDAAPATPPPPSAPAAN